MKTFQFVYHGQMTLRLSANVTVVRSHARFGHDIL